jgi:4-hydroxybenzoate polyprenyltransferase
VKSFIRVIVFSNIWVAFCLLGLTLSSEIFLCTTNFEISQFVFFATIFAYNFQRIIRLKKGHNHSYKSWLEKNRKAIYLLMFLAAIISTRLFFDFKSSTQIAILFTGALSIFYPFGLRKIPFAKIFIISFVWAVSTMLILVLENNISISQNIIWQLVSRFLFVFAITVPFDIRDVEYDSQNVITIPLFFGVKIAKIISVFALFICCIISFFQHLELALNLPNLLALILLYILAAIFIQKSDKNKGEIYFSFWVESLSLFSYFLLVISKLIF